MGRGLREVAADVVCTLGMEEDEGKIDALAASLAEAANKTFGSNSDLETKLMTSLNQSSLSQSARIKGFLTGEHGGGTIITGELTPIQRERLEQTMKPEQIESLGLARNILQRMMRENEEPEPDSERDEGTETPNKGIQFSFSGGAESPLGKVAEDMKSEENDALRVDTALNASIVNSLIPDMIEMSETFI